MQPKILNDEIMLDADEVLKATRAAVRKYNINGAKDMIEAIRDGVSPETAFEDQAFFVTGEGDIDLDDVASLAEYITKDYFDDICERVGADEVLFVLMKDNTEVVKTFKHVV